MKRKTNFSIFRLFALFFLLIPCFFAFFGCSPASANAPSIEISQDGYWVINGQKTSTKAEGKDGTNGENASKISLKQVYDELVEAENYSKSFSEFLKEYLSTSIDLTANVSEFCKPSIVAITRKNSSKKGSGIVIKKDNSGNAFVLTNFHVCYPNQQSEEFWLYLADDENKQTKITASFVAGNENFDLAILKVENQAAINAASIATFADSNARDGDSCIAIGNTNSKGIAISIGNVSKDLENVAYNAGMGDKYRTVLRHCAYIAAGSSGGGLFNLAGELIGVTCAGEVGDQTLMNYAIPIEIVSDFVSEVINN